jgi:hypothetical protein
MAFLAAGKRLLVLGDLGTNLPPATTRPLLAHPGTYCIGNERPFTVADLPVAPQVDITPAHDLALTVQRVGDCATVHLIRYDYDAERDRVPLLPELTMRLRLPTWFSGLSCFSPGEELAGALEADGEWHRLRLRNVPLYGVALLKPEPES